MTMRCFACRKKLHIFSDYTQIVVDGEKKEICTPCNRKREKEEVNRLLQTDKGKKEVSLKGTALVSMGVLEIGVSIFIFTIMPLAAVILIGFGCYSIYKGISYKRKAKN